LDFGELGMVKVLGWFCFMPFLLFWELGTEMWRGADRCCNGYGGGKQFAVEVVNLLVLHGHK